MALLLFYFFLALGVSFLCSMLEASLLSVPLSHVWVMVRKGSKIGVVLEKMKNNIDRPLSAILSLNTIAHTIGAAGVGGQIYEVYGSQWVALGSAILTFLILIFSEIIPKTIGAVYAKGLAGFTAVTIQVLMFITFPIVLLCEFASKCIWGRRVKTWITREEFSALTEMGEEEGIILQKEARVIRNLLALHKIKIKDIMTPRGVVKVLPEDMTVAEAASPENPLRFARIPIYGDKQAVHDDLTGVVHRYSILEAYRSGDGDKTLKELSAPITVVSEHATADGILDEFVKSRGHLFQVVDEYGGTSGIVTLEDAIETLLGVEIMDETDAVADMQKLARLRFQRNRDLKDESRTKNAEKKDEAE